MEHFYQNCLRPKHWFQFAGDTAFVTALVSDNQHLCNVFLTSWADWTKLEKMLKLLPNYRLQVSFHKIEIMQRYVFFKLKWCFSVYHLTETWVSENLDNVTNRY